jgi:tetratricopeptide (TPR) repeat protein
MAEIATRFINVFKIVYYTTAYWAVGLTEEEYHIRKANYWIELENYRRAIRNYQKALKASEDSQVRAAMAWCYGEIGMIETCLQHYRTSYETNDHPSIALRLAYAELNHGNHEESSKLLQYVKDNADRMHEEDAEELTKLEEDIDKERNLPNKPL